MANHVVEALEQRQLLTTYTWTNLNNATANWNTNSNWSPSGYPNAMSAVANLNVAATVDQSITLGADLTVGTLTLGTSHLQTINAGNTLTFNNGSAQAKLIIASSQTVKIYCNLALGNNTTISVPAGDTLIIYGNIDTKGHTLTVDSAGSVTINGAISNSTGNGILTEQGGGTLTLAGNNTYTGVTNVYSSALNLSGGTINSTGAVSLVGTATGPAILSGTGNIAGAVTFGAYSQIGAGGFNTGTSTLTLGAGSNVLLTGSITGNLALSSAGNATLTGNTGNSGNITLSCNIALNNSRTLYINGSNYITLSGAISGSGGLNVQSGMLILGGSNSYTGSTMIAAHATLGLLHNATIGSTSTITVASYCTMLLDTNCSVAGSIIVDGGMLSGPGTIGALTVKNGGQAYFTGTINGAVSVSASGHAELAGMVTGNVNVSTAAFLGLNTSALTATGNTTTTGTITVNNSYFSPNGTVNCSGLILTNNSVFECEIDSSTAGSGYPQVNVTSGSVSLGTTSSLVVSGSRTSNVSDSPLSLINNVSGTFLNQSAGSYVSSNRVRYSVSYLGGSGHAFSLTDSTPVVAVGDTFSLYEDASYSGNVLGNDTGNGLTVYSINGRTDYVNNPNLHTTDASGNITGTLYLHSNGSFTYTPTTNYASTGYGFVGLDQLTIYTNTDGTYTSNAASLKFNVVDPTIGGPGETIHTIANTPLNSALFTEFSQAAANGYTANIIWGDGTANGTGTISADTGGSYQWKVNGTHTYTTPGVYTAWVTIQDNFGMTFSAQTTVDVAPPAPTGLTATPGDGQAALNWTAVTGATGYDVYGSTDGSAFTQLTASPVTATSYTPTGLRDGSTYYYKVSAVGTGGEGPLSGSVSATPEPATPTGVTAVAEDTQAALSWNSVSTATSYNIYQQSSLGTYVNITNTAAVSFSTPTTAVITGLTNGTNYSDKVSAVNTGESNLSSAVSVTPAASTVEFLTTTPASTSEIDLAWNLNTIGAQNVEVDDSTDGSTWSVVTSALPGTALNDAVTGLAENTAYSFRVRAIYPSGSSPATSAYSQPAAASTLSAITGLTATAASASEIDLNWTTNIANSTGIIVKRSTDGTNFTQIASLANSATTYNDTGRAENTVYYYQVYSLTASGASEEVASTSATTAAAVDSVSASAASISEIDLTWSLNVTDATAIEVDRSADGGTTWATLTNSLSPSTTTYADTGRADNTDYTYRVRANRPGGWSAYSPTADATTTAAVDTLAATTANTGQINLTWNLNVTGQTALAVYRSVDGGSFAYLTDSTVSPTLAYNSTSYNDTSVAEGHTYAYEVQAKFSSGSWSSLSASASASTTPIQNLDYLPTIGGIALAWSNFSTTASSLTIARSTDGVNFGTPVSLSASATTYTDSSLTANAQYWYKLTLTETGGAVTTQTANTWTLPMAPTNVQVVGDTPTEVDLQWTYAGSAGTSFLIERSDDGGSTFNVVGLTSPGATTFSDTTVPDATACQYLVAAVSGDGAKSNPVVSAVSAPTPATAPSNVTIHNFGSADDGNLQIDLSWAENEGDVPNATGFIIVRTGGGSTQTFTLTGSDNSEYADTSVVAATAYTYTVFATGATGTSAGSNSATTVTPPSYTLAAGTGVYEGGAETLTITDPHASGEVDPVTGWTIDWGDGSTPQTFGGEPGSFTHIYADPGNFTITATTADRSYTGTMGVNILAYDTGTLTLTDNSTPSIPIFGGPFPFIPITTPYQVDAAFTEPHGEPVVEWLVDWGDGTIQAVGGPTSGTVSSTQSYVHTYAYPGKYGPQVCAVTSNGVYRQLLNSTGSAHGVTVTGSANGVNVDEGTGKLTISGSIDVSATTAFGAGGAPSLSALATNEGTDLATLNFMDQTLGGSPVTYTISWGDGAIGTQSVTPGHTSTLMYHQYAHQGAYYVHVTGNGDFGTSWLVGIAPTFPTIFTPETQHQNLGDPLIVRTMFSDVNADPNAVAYVNWGDGNGWEPAKVVGHTITATLPTPDPEGSYSAQIEVDPLGRSPALFDGDSVYGATTNYFTVDATGRPAGTIESVAFSALNPIDFHPVTSDTLGASFGFVQWRSGIPEPSSYPICYTRSGTSNDQSGAAYITATARLQLANFAGSEGWVYANIDGVDTQPVAASLFNGSTVASATVTDPAALPNTIAKANETIKWYVSNDKTNWSYAGTTTNLAYIVNGTTLDGNQSIETVLNVGCVYASGMSLQNPSGTSAQDVAAKNLVVNQIFDGAFKPLSIVPVGRNRMLFYWRRAGDNSTPATTDGLIRICNGRCGAWANFFIDVLGAQGIPAYFWAIKASPPANGFFTKDGVSQGGTTTQGVNVPSWDGNNHFFADHAVVELFNTDPSGNQEIYDPSYGKRYPSQQAWRDGSLGWITYPYGGKTKHASGDNDTYFVFQY